MSAPRGRPPGTRKTGGRGPGTPNRNTTALSDKLEALGCDLVAELVRIARDPKTETSCTVSIYTQLLRYISPVPRPVEVTDGPGTTTEKSTITEAQALRWASLVMETFGANPEHQKTDTEQAEQPQDDKGGSNEQ